jgi:CHAT domain-containing protein
VRPEEKPQETALFPDEHDLLAAALGYEPAPPPVAELLSLRLSVAHGSLTHARFPVAVGHYQKDTIVNAEAFLDRRLGGVLTERYRLGLYPGAVGTVEVLHTPDFAPPGALVIGLGELGEISAQNVTEGVLQAGLRHALLVAERPALPGEGNRWRSAGFSTVLLGTGGGRSLSVEESVAAIVRGVVQANRALRSQGLWNRVRIDEIELIELYEAVAIRAARVVRSIVEHLRVGLEPHERIEPALHLRCLPGGEVRPPVSQYDTGWWRRLQITASGSGRLSFEVLTERARTEQRQQFLQQSLVDRFVEEAASSNEYSREVTSTLFELLLPNELKDQAHEETDLVLVLDEATAQYPWELLTERLQRRSEPFATSAGLIRQLRTREGEFRSLVRAPRERFALVVGDPRSNMAELPGAQAEARSVREVVQSAGFETVALIRPYGWEVIRELFAREYQILHLAGHGLYEPGQPRESGMVLGDSLFLSTAEMGQLRAVPPFVFLNCCHLGQVDRRTPFSKLAASLATGLIRMGVRAVVAAGWAVDDHLASTFARELYQGLLSGQTFGRSVLRARRAAFEQDPENNTWGAYQCYGDPDFVLDLRQSYRHRGADPRAFVSPREFLDELAGLRAEAVTTDLAGWDVLRRRLETLETALPREWRTGELLAALAGARADLGAWWEAIVTYREAVDTWGAEVPVQAVQALANLEIRYAGRLRRDNVVAPGEGPKELLELAQRRLQWLLELGETPERLALVGAAYKRIALAAANAAERRAALRKAGDYYAQAHQLVLERKKSPDPYVSLNWIACRHLLGDGEPEELLGVLTDCERVGSHLAATSPAFHHRLHAIEAVLHRHLILGDLAEQEALLLEGYRRALSAGSVSLEVASVAEHLELLIAGSEKKSPQVTQVLRRLVDSLGGRAALGV